MGSSFWRWNLTILLLLFGVPCTQSSCQGNYLPGGYYFTTGRNMVEDRALFGYVFKTLTVSMAVECFRKCMSDCQCISFNYLTNVNKDNCELNEENKYLKPNALKAKPGSQYYDFVIDYNVVKGSQPTTCHNGCCQSQPCLNGGTCSESCDVTDKRSWCACAPGFTGFRCEKVFDKIDDESMTSIANRLRGHLKCMPYSQHSPKSCNIYGIKVVHSGNVNWIKINTSPVCFGARDSSYGVVTIQKAGHVFTFKLVYLSGYVTCRNTEPQHQSNWACKVFDDSFNLATFITDNLQQRVLPTDNALFRGTSDCSNNIFYGLPGVTPDSPELVFNNFSSPMAVSVGQEFQIWFAEDLFNCWETNNEGQTCTDMYGLYV